MPWGGLPPVPAIGRANLDGTGVDPGLHRRSAASAALRSTPSTSTGRGGPPSGAPTRRHRRRADLHRRPPGDTHPFWEGVAVDRAHLYWTDSRADARRLGSLDRPRQPRRRRLQSPSSSRAATTLIGALAVDALTDTAHALGPGRPPNGLRSRGASGSASRSGSRPRSGSPPRPPARSESIPTYKLRPKKVQLAAGKTKKLRLKPKKARRRSRRALETGGEKAKAKLRVRLTDLAGNRETKSWGGAEAMTRSTRQRRPTVFAHPRRPSSRCSPTLVVLPLALAARADAFVYWAWGTSTNPFDPAPSGVGRWPTSTAPGSIRTSSPSTAIPSRSPSTAPTSTGSTRTSTTPRSGARSSTARGRTELGHRLGPLPNDLAVNDAHIYWAHRGGIGRANLDGTGADPSSSTRWGGLTPQGSPGLRSAPPTSTGRIGNRALRRIRSLGCANIDGSGANYELVTANGLDVALDAAHVYWTTLIGRARQPRRHRGAGGFIPASGDAGSR